MHEGLPVEQRLLKLHIGPPVILHGLYVICKGLPAMQRVCLFNGMTEIVIHMCHNDIMIQT